MCACKCNLSSYLKAATSVTSSERPSHSPTLVIEQGDPEFDLEGESMRTARHIGLALVATVGVVSSAAYAQSFDQQFLETMRSHHQMGLHMTETFEKRAEHEELKKAAAKMIDEHKKDLAKIASLLGKPKQEPGSHGAPVATDAMPANIMGLPLQGKMESDKLSTGSEPDRHFLKMMIPHHAGAILMADEAAKRAQSEEVRAFARMILDGQSKEIGKMHEMHAKWYGKL